MANWATFGTEETKRLRRGDVVRIGNKVYRMCDRCKQPVQVNKWLIGGMHVCE